MTNPQSKNPSGITWFAIPLILLAASPWVLSDTEKVSDYKVRLEHSIDNAIEFLLNYQNKGGSWGSPRLTKALNVYAPVPGAHRSFKTASTALCLEALLGLEGKDVRIKTAAASGIDWLLKNSSRLRRGEVDELYNLWACAYSLQYLVKVYQTENYHVYRDQTRTAILEQIRNIEKFSTVDGGWGYYDFRHQTKKPSSKPFSFFTATILLALHDAHEAGFEIDETVIRKAIKISQEMKKNDHTYLYSYGWKYRPMGYINRVPACLSRSQACNLALHHWGDQSITEAVFIDWADKLIEKNEWLSMGRKRPIPHESWFGISGYFYLYGHYYAARCLLEIEPQKRVRHQEQLAGVLMNLQEKDGSWWDFPLYDYHKSYGTAFALMALRLCTTTSTR